MKCQNTLRLRRALVANRDEIAVRIIRAAKDLGIETVLTASAADTGSLASRMADRTLEIGPAASGKSYLRAELLVHAAIYSGSDALHPGYGWCHRTTTL